MTALDMKALAETQIEFDHVPPGLIAEIIIVWNRRVSPSQGEGPAADVVREIWDAATNAVCQTMQDRGMCNCRDGNCVAAKIEPAQQDIEYFAALASLAPRAPADEQSGETSHVADDGQPDEAQEWHDYDPDC